MIPYGARVAFWLAAVLFFAAIPARLMFGWWGVLAALLLCLLAPLIGHVRGLLRLLDWLKKPLDAPVPEGEGIWDFVFSALRRRVRQRDAQQEALAHALERFQNAAEAMPDGIIRCDPSGHIEWMNQSAATHFALDPLRDCGQLLVHMVRTPGFIAYMKKAQFDRSFTCRSERVPGLTLLLNVIPFGEEQSLLLSRDISRFERLERMRRDFVANVSHELRTPLTVISGFAETLVDDAPGNQSADAQRYLGLIHEQALRMQRIIQDLLSLSALEHSPTAEIAEKVAVEPLLDAIRRDAEALSAGAHRIEIQIDPSAPVILGCRTELHCAFANLASNAIRYSPDGGRIAIVWRRLGTAVEFAVDDDGIGIDAEHIPRLTERFYRVNSGRSATIGGTGLGLSIVKHVLARHEAELLVNSELGQGSRFSALFPAIRVPLQAPDDDRQPAID